ncbi:P-loop containing nucleoside triphosphate hydrolase protein, partial [Pisolithus tinctorius]
MSNGSKARRATFIIISPLKALQRDQKHRFQKMGVSAIDVNGETWSPKLRQDFKNNKYQAILIGPEMCLQHEGFRELLKSPDFSNDLVSIVVDKAHCISQWGGDFRVAYSSLGDVHSYVPTNIPILATSATLAPAALKEVQHKLQMDPINTFFLNLGNDWPNITPSVIKMRNSSDYAALLPLIGQDIQTGPNLPKTIIFTNSIQKTLEIHRFLGEHLPPTCGPYLDIFHALRSTASKREALKYFRKGKTRVLIATEAAGM